MDSSSGAKTILIADVLKESWQLVSGLKWPVFWLSVISLAVFICLFVVENTLFHHFSNSSLGNNWQDTLPILPPEFLIGFSYTVILCMLGVRQSIGLPVSVIKTILQCRGHMLQLFYAFLFCYVIIAGLDLASNHMHILGLKTFINFYINILVFVYVVPLIITRKCSFGSALKYANLKLASHRRVVIFSSSLMLLIIIAAILPLGIGMIWAMPMQFTMNGILFRETCGLQRVK